MIISRNLLLAGFALAIGALSASAQTTARDALAILERGAGRTETANAVAIIGFNGQDQPAAWRILVKEPRTDQQLREYTIQNQQLLGPTQVERNSQADLPNTPVLLSALRIDSTEAFRIADDAAIASGIAFDKVNYQLRWRGNDSEPTWMATLIDTTGKTVGNVYIASGSGQVMHQDFSLARNSAAAKPQPRLRPVSARAAQDLQPRAEVSRVAQAPTPAPAPAPTPRRAPAVAPAPASPTSNIWLRNPARRRQQQQQQQPAVQPQTVPVDSIPARYRPR